MLIRCPKCGTGFNLAAAKIPTKGAKVRCSACTHTFRVRVGENDEPVYFYKKGEEPDSGETMVGKPIDFDTLGETPTVAADDVLESTQFGIPQRSKSAREGYNPFPLAGNITGEQPAITEEDAKNNSTQLFGSGPDSEELDVDELDLDDLLDDDDDDDESANYTQLAPQALAQRETSDQTQLGGPVRRTSDGSPPQLRTTDDDLRENGAGQQTQALGSGKLDLFDGELPEAPSEPPPIDIDPFGDAFDGPAEGDAGLLMASTPETDDPVFESTSLRETSSDVSMSEEDFLMGGTRGDFGDAASLVDQSFGEDVPAFDAQSGVVDVEKAPRTRSRRGSSRGGRSGGDAIELDRAAVEPKVPTSRPQRPEVSTRTAERPRPAKPNPAYVNQVGATSPIRRTFDIIFIALVVTIGFVALISARAGGFVDFQRFGHMVEVAFTDTEFVPREEWKQVVELPSPEPPPDEPLRLYDVRATERPVEDGPLLVVSGKIRNYSMLEFKAVKVRAVVEVGDKVIAERVHTVGQSIDRKKLGAAKTADAVKESLRTKLPDIGKEGITHFAIVFDDVPREVVASGAYDYSVAIAD